MNDRVQSFLNSLSVYFTRPNSSSCKPAHPNPIALPAMPRGWGNRGWGSRGWANRPRWSAWDSEDMEEEDEPMHPASSSSASWRGRGRGKASVSSEALPEDTAADPVVESSEALPDDGQYGIHYTARDKGSGKGYMKGRWRPVFEEGLLLRLTLQLLT